MLEAMKPQRAFDAHRETPGAFGLGLDRLDHRHQFSPRHHAVHLVEKLLAAGELTTLFECDLGKCLLLHGGASRLLLRFS